MSKLDELLVGRPQGYSQNLITDIDIRIREAIILSKDIYQSKVHDRNGKPLYFLSNDELEYAVGKFVDKYGFDAVKTLHAEVKRRNQLGTRSRWYLDAIEKDYESLLNDKKEVQVFESNNDGLDEMDIYTDELGRPIEIPF